MGKFIKVKFIICIFIQVFLFSTNTFALGIVMPTRSEKSCLAPSIQLKADAFQKSFGLQSSQRKKITNPIFENLDVAADSPSWIFLEELGIEAVNNRGLKNQTIPITIKNTKILSENFNFDKNDYSAMLLIADKYPVGIYVESGYYPWRYFIDISGLLFLEKDFLYEKSIKSAVKAIKHNIESNIYTRRMPITKTIALYDSLEGDIPVVFDVHPPNDLPSTLLYMHTRDNIQADQTVLDIGTGTGKVGALLAKSRGCNVVSTDIKQTAIANAKVTAAAFGISDKVEVIASDLFAGVQGRKFDAIYFYPPTLEMKSMSVAKFMGVQDGAAEISPEETEDLLDRLFSEFEEHLTDDGTMYLALMSSNKLAYEKIDKLVSEGKITKEVVHTYYEDRGAKSFETLSLKPKKAVKKLSDYLELPQQKDISEVVEFIEKQLKQDGVKKENIKGIHLMGSRLWSENAADWDVVICIDDQDFINYTANAWPYNGTQIDFKIINMRDYEKERDLVFELLMKANITGRLIYGEDVIADIIKKSKVSFEDILFTAEFSSNKSYGRTDVIDIYSRSKSSKTRDLFEGEGERETFFASLLSDVSGTIFSSMLVLRNIIDRLELTNNFYSYDEIFEFWQRSKQKKMSYDEFKGYRTSTEAAIESLKKEPKLGQAFVSESNNEASTDELFEIISVSPVRDENFKSYMSNKITQNGGRISFAEFMQDVLYSEYGFFTNFVSVGRNQDFDTYAQELPFAHSLAIQLIEMWEKMGKPEKFSIVEMGAGSGELVKNIIAYIQQNEPRLYESLDYIIVEISPKLVKDQKETLLNEFDSLKNVPVRWIEGTALDLSKLKAIEGVFLSNEMPDNFPVHRIKKVDGKLQEIYVTYKDGEFQDELGPLSTPELKEYVENLEVEVSEGIEIPVNLNLRIWQENIAKALKRGFVITIDYGGKIGELSDNPQAVWNKETEKMINDEDKIAYLYANSGSCDITADVNFFDAAAWGKESGLNIHGYTLQRDFLWNLEFDEMLDDLPREVFKGQGPNAISNDVATNFHFKVLIQSKKVDKDITLKGLENTEEFQHLYNKGVELVLPFGPEQSSFLVVTNDRSNIMLKLISEGRQKIQDHLSTFYSYGGFHDFAQLEDAGALDVRKGKFVLHFSREQLEDIRIYNEQGGIVFDNMEYSKDKNKLKDFGIGYDAFEKKFLSRLDIERMGIEDIPDLLYLHSDGQIMTFPQDMRPLDVIDRETLSDDNVNKIMQQSI